MKPDIHGFDISIIIVNYNSGNFLMNCIESIRNNVNANYEIIVVDNNSTDDSLKFFESIKNIEKTITLIRNEQNVGFARANNTGAKAARGTYLHFLNPDTELTPEISHDYKHILSGAPGIIYVNRISNLDKSPEQSRNLMPLISNYVNAIFGSSKLIYWYTGATVIISDSDFKKIGGWSEEYFMYSEDMDLFYKASVNKIRTVELQNPIVHIGKGSTSKAWSTYEREKRIQKSFRIFYIKHNKKIEYYLIKLITMGYVFFKSPAKAFLMLRIGLSKN